MAEGLNKVMLLGNIGQDPELRVTGAGLAILKFSFATSRRYKDNSGNRHEETEWHRVVVFGTRAEALSKFLSRGDKLLVEGRIKYGSYLDKEGVTKRTTDIVAENIFTTGGRLEGSSDGGGGARIANSQVDAEGATETYGGVPDDDDIPF